MQRIWVARRFPQNSSHKVHRIHQSPKPGQSIAAPSHHALRGWVLTPHRAPLALGITHVSSCRGDAWQGRARGKLHCTAPSCGPSALLISLQKNTEMGESGAQDKLFIPDLSLELKTGKRQLRSVRFYNSDHEIATSVS